MGTVSTAALTSTRPIVAHRPTTVRTSDRPSTTIRSALCGRCCTLRIHRGRPDFARIATGSRYLFLVAGGFLVAGLVASLLALYGPDGVLRR